MPSTAGDGHASTAFVWRDWQNQTGYTSDGFVFLAGMLNGAYAVGTLDCVSHLAEEISRPRTNIPTAIGAQVVVGLVTAFFYLIALFYSIRDLDSALRNLYTFPLAEVYLQATNSRGGSPTICTCIGTYITSGRMLWTSPAMTRHLSANPPAASAQRIRIRLTRRWLVVLFALCLGVSTLVPSSSFPRSLTSLRSCPICFLDGLMP